MSAIDITGPIAASAAVNTSITSACVRSAHHAVITASNASRLSIRDANEVNLASFPTPSKFKTRAATVSLDVDTPIHFPSLHWYVPRGTEYGSPEPSRSLLALEAGLADAWRPGG